jgi:hypothetical protein
MKAIQQKLLPFLRRFHHDDEGAAILVYSFAALGLVGAVWMIMGAGQRVVQKETVQTAADAAAYSAAVIKAKGLNIIAFINLIMAAVMAIIMLLRLIKILLIAVTTIATIACIFPPYLVCGALPALAEVTATYTRLEEQLERPLLAVIRGMGKAERAFSKGVIFVAQAEGYRVGLAAEYRTTTFSKAAAIVPAILPLPIKQIDRELPVKDGEFKDLCNKAAETFGDAVVEALAHVGTPQAVDDFIGGIVGGLAKALVPILCTDGGSLPNYKQSEKSTDIFKCLDPGSAANTEVTWKFVNVEEDVNGGRGTPGPIAFKSNEVDGACLLKEIERTGATATESCDVNGKKYFFDTGDFDYCVITKPQVVDQVDKTGLAPLVLSDDWLDRRYTTGITALIGDTNRKGRAGAVAPGEHNDFVPEVIVGSARAIFDSYKDEHDLWHMGWRARMIRIQIGSQADQNEQANGTPGDAPANTAGNTTVDNGAQKKGAKAFFDKITKKVTAFGKSGFTTDWFILH